MSPDAYFQGVGFDDSGEIRDPSLVKQGHMAQFKVHDLSAVKLGTRVHFENRKSGKNLAVMYVRVCTIFASAYVVNYLEARGRGKGTFSLISHRVGLHNALHELIAGLIGHMDCTPKCAPCFD